MGKGKETSPSLTALGVAWQRAAHQILDQRPILFDDHVAPKLFSAEALRLMLAEAEGFQVPLVRGLRTHILLRSRFAEDRLAEAVAGGMRQYIILGAGYDTFAARQPEWASDLVVTEVDQLATQSDKLARVEKGGLTIPNNVRYVNADFENETLEAVFARSEIRTNEPAFFSWLGVTVYLTEAAIDAVLSTVGRFPPGSEIVMTFVNPRKEYVDGTGPSLATGAAEAGEPWITYLTQLEVENKLTSRGFSQIEFLTPETAAAKYFGNGNGLSPPTRTSIVWAQL